MIEHLFYLVLINIQKNNVILNYNKNKITFTPKDIEALMIIASDNAINKGMKKLLLEKKDYIQIINQIKKLGKK